MTLYGIRNCDTMTKARAWLDARGIRYQFHDYRVAGTLPEQVAAWVDEHGWERVLNRAGTTFRGLPPEARVELDAAAAIALMVAHPTLIKRPVLDLGSQTLVGFDPSLYEAALSMGD